MRRILPVLGLFAIATLPGFAQDRVIQLFEQLTSAPGPPGYEEAVRQIMVEAMKPLADKISYDGLGSVIAVQGTTGPRIMLDAHMDELGGMIRRIRPDGFLTFQMLGSWLDQALVDQRWIIIGSKGPVRAITGIRDAHIATPEERNRVYFRDSLALDVGAKNEAEVRAMGIEPGDTFVPEVPFAALNGTDNYVAKAWDDRIGCAVLLEVMRRLHGRAHPNQVFYAGTVQEEIGMRGAATSSEIIKPDIGFAIEVGIVKDVPGTSPNEAQEVLGGGPGFFYYDWSALPNRKLVSFVKQTAAEIGIPLQYNLISAYGEDAASIQKSNGGVPVINLVIPSRYTHAHNGIINRKDFDRMVELLSALIMRLDAATVARIREFSPPQ